VAEKGTEAAAATAVIMLARGLAPSHRTVVHFDRPFIYAVIDEATGVPLFLGTMDDPSLAVRD